MATWVDLLNVEMTEGGGDSVGDVRYNIPTTNNNNKLGLRFICAGMFFLQLLISYLHKSAHYEVNGGIFFCTYFCIFWIKCIFMHILKKMDIIEYFNYKNAKNAYFMVYFVKSNFITVQKFLKVIKSILSFCCKLVR